VHLVLQMEPAMATTMTLKGQVTIPRQVRVALGLSPGDRVEFAVNGAGEVVVQKAGARTSARAGRKRDRFEAARGRAQVKWRTDELMALLRAAD
jgi:AbrB family looped-hinge helix DNA binding protein